jgi:hypothetical protein
MSLRSRIKALEAKRGGGLMTVIVSGGYAYVAEEVPDARHLADARPGETFAGYCARQLAATAKRLSHLHFRFGERYVDVNIPAAAVEAVEDGKAKRG